ncbi:acetate kinase [Janthinobacterium sp. J1-1]|uniref:acetate kinase n=1 Tax=Janthinobacterium sp. J1-1 TaxID=3065910 RepID=UPI002811BE75|nr:acetate kinase [Janthinobacterium sp. J1-1]
MRYLHLLRLGAAGASALLLSAAAHGQDATAPVPAQVPAASQEALAARLEDMKAQLAEQRRLLDMLRGTLQAQQRRIDSLQGGTPVASELLGAQRGLGVQEVWGQEGLPGSPAPVTAPAPATAPVSPPSTPAPVAVGRPPGRDSRPPEVAPIFEQPGVLTPRGKFVLEPSAQFGYSSSNRVALVGYTIIPALLIGLIDVREVKRNTFTAALTGRTGITNRFEIEARIPYVYRSDSTVSRELFTGTAVERVFDTSGKKLGDVELAARYQLNDGGADKSYYVAGLRFKSRTGRDPFSVVTDCVRRCVGENATGTGLPLDLPTGSGFYSLQPSLTWLFPSDPAVFFGSISYLHSFKRHDVSRLLRDGLREPLGTVEPGKIFGVNFGIGLALNEKGSLSLGYDHSTIGRTRQNGTVVPGAVRTQLGTLLMGYSYRLAKDRTLNISVGAGLTRDTPDVSLSVRLPMTF